MGRASGASPGRLHPCLALLIWGLGRDSLSAPVLGQLGLLDCRDCCDFGARLAFSGVCFIGNALRWVPFSGACQRGHDGIHGIHPLLHPSHARGTSIHSLGRHWRTTDIPFPSSTDQLGANETPGGLGLSAFVETNTLKIIITCHHRVQCNWARYRNPTDIRSVR